MRQLPARTFEGSGARFGHRGPGARLGHLARFALIALVAAAAGCAAGESGAPASLDELAQEVLATIDGELAVPGLREPVEVIRDEWGVPHIYAQNDDDLFFAQGYVMAPGSAVADGDVAPLARRAVGRDLRARGARLRTAARG